MTHRILTIATLAVALASPAIAERTPSPDGAEVYFIAPADGATLTNPVTFQFGLRNMGVAPAGVEWPDTGHHHLLINVAPDDVDFDEIILADENHVHFGGGQTEVTLNLPQGTHTFMLLLGDAFHVPHDPPVMSEILTLTIQ